jgi:PilZ domain
MAVHCCLLRKKRGTECSTNWELDTYDPSKPDLSTRTRLGSSKSATATPAERRQFARRACRIGTQITTVTDGLTMAGTITDISFGGCYIEMLSPLPAGTLVEIAFDANGTLGAFAARVRSQHMGFGMGLAFTKLTPQNLEILQRVTGMPIPAAAMPAAPTPAVQPPATPAPPPSAPAPTSAAASAPTAAPGFDPANIPVTRETFSALLRILLRRGLITGAELTEEIEKIKAGQK